MMLKWSKNVSKFFHTSFEIALILKALNGLFEIIGGVLLIFLNPDALGRIVGALTQEELAEDSKDIIANALTQMSISFSVDAQHFGVFYLLSHGIVKLILVALLWKRKLWAYPLTIIFLLIFIIYQVYRYAVSPSLIMILLTVMDFVVIFLTFIEYKRQKDRIFKP